MVTHPCRSKMLTPTPCRTRVCRRRPTAYAPLRLSAAPDARRWVAGRSVVAWRGPEQKPTKSDRPRPQPRCPWVMTATPTRPRPGGRRGPRRQAYCRTC